MLWTTLGVRPGDGENELSPVMLSPSVVTASLSLLSVFWSWSRVGNENTSAAGALTSPSTPTLSANNLTSGTAGTTGAAGADCC